MMSRGKRDGTPGRPGREGPAHGGGAPEERESDELVQWLGDVLEQPEPSDPANGPYYEWLARDLAGRQGSGQRADAPARADAFARAMAERLAAERVRVATVRGAPERREPSVIGTVLQAVDAAARARSAVVVDHAVAAGEGRELWDEPAERWVALPDGLPDGRYVALTVAGDSMLPVLHEGDTVLVRLGPELARETVVVARRPDDGYVVKRVGAVTQEEVELTSLNPAYAPVRIPRDERLVVGTVVLRWCGHAG